MCSSSEQAAQKSETPSMDAQCAKLIADAPERALFFSGDAKANREDIATEQAKKESIIGLVQFFQSQFIEGEQVNLFDEIKPAGSDNDQFQKQWAEVSYEMIAEQHNKQAFTHNQTTTEDSSGYSTDNMLIISQEWFRDHWENSLSATDSTFFHQEVKSSKYYEDMKQLDIQKEHPCHS